MAAINESIRIVRQEAAFTFALKQERLVNVSALQAMARAPHVLEFLSQPERSDQIFALAQGLPPKWRDPKLVRLQGADFFRDLGASGVAVSVPGSVGRRARVEGGAGVGEVDFAPGVWLHIDLVLPLVEWMTHRHTPTEEKPLVEFVKRALAEAGVKVQKRQGPKSAAQMFMVGVSEKLQKLLRTVDASMIEAGESFDDRRDALTSLLKSVKGGQK